MPFVPKKQAFNAHINEVVLGVGDKATAIGGQNVLPFHTFDAEIKNAPKIGVELTDLGMAEYTMPGERPSTPAAPPWPKWPSVQKRSRALLSSACTSRAQIPTV